MRHGESKSVKTTNGEHMLIEGLAPVDFFGREKRIRSDVYIPLDLDDLILGVHWMENQRRMIWDFEAQRMQFVDDLWIVLQQETETGSMNLRRKRRCPTSETRDNCIVSYRIYSPQTNTYHT